MPTTEQVVLVRKCGPERLKRAAEILPEEHWHSWWEYCGDPEAGVASRPDVVKELMGTWLGRLAPWDVFSSWTFSQPVEVHGAMYWARRHLTYLEKAAEQPVYAFVGVERGETGGLEHVHALLGNVAHLKAYCGKRLGPEQWRPRTARYEQRGPLRLSALGIPMPRPLVLVRDTGFQCCMVHSWPAGIARVLPYNRNLGASHYVSKYITKRLAEWDLIGFPAVPQISLDKRLHPSAQCTGKVGVYGRSC